MNGGRLSAAANWYSYYAGYSTEFVGDILDKFDGAIHPGFTVLDPWNGSGTTTYVAARRGIRAIGFDLNPALLFVAKARLLDPSHAPRVRRLVQAVLRAAAYGQTTALADDADEPLLSWFVPKTARFIRAVERSIFRHAVRNLPVLALLETPSGSAIDLETSFLYVVLFETVRGFLRSFIGTNPTWTRTPADQTSRLSITNERFEKSVIATLERLLGQLPNDHGRQAAALVDLTCEIGVASSVDIPLPLDSVDLVVSSPPYCTRIDYVVGTRPELAILGYGVIEIEALRRRMIGSPLVSSGSHRSSSDWGPSLSAFLARVAEHPSKASSGYYLKYFERYFQMMSSSLKQLRRVLRADGSCYLVVQDSFYKEVHVDLASYLIEIAETHDWHCASRVDFHVRRTKASMNPRARKYRDQFAAVETVLTLRPGKKVD